MKQKRPPIITVLGHVDHGKTSLLDAIRKTNVQSKEAGGITQSIGATQVETKSATFTFVDTPGHAAFSKMRERGAKVADIALLVVAADDGVKPQTKEALDYIKKAQIPMIVVFTKIDLPSADVQKALGELEKLEVFFEKRGGDTPYAQVSSKTGEGIDSLLELIELLAEVNDISADPEATLDALVIESNKDKRGVVVSVVIRNGTLKKGEDVYASVGKARVRGLFNYLNKPINTAIPGDPALIMGFSELPEVGDSITNQENRTTQSKDSSKNVSEVEEEQVGVVLKASTSGALEAIVQSLPNDAIVLKSGVGEVTENDVFFAKSANAAIMAFEIRPSNNIKKLCETEAVEIYNFEIIYELIEKVEELIAQKKITVLGKAQVVASFPYEKLHVAGCKIIEGEIRAKSGLILQRGDKVLGEVTVKSLKRGKEDIELARAGEECGILFVPQLDFEAGDMLLSINK